jgi:two-component system cell cycle sensor histidine kinase/response regulator CckA
MEDGVAETNDSAGTGDAAMSSPLRLEALRHTALLDTSPEEAFERLTRLAARLLGAPTAALSLVAEDRQFLNSSVGYAERWQTSRSMPLAYSYCRHAVASGQPVVIGDARTDPRVSGSPAIAEDGSIAYLGIPIRVDGQVVGAFCVLDQRPREWSRDDVELLQDLAAAVLIAIQHRMARRDVAASRLSERRLAAQNAATRILAQADTLEDAAADILRTLCRTLGWEGGVFWCVDEEAGVLVCASAWSAEERGDDFVALSRRIVLLPGVCLPGRVWQSGSVGWVADLGAQADSPRAAAAGTSGVRGAFAFPLSGEGKVMGVLEFVTHHPYEPDAELVETMEALAAQVEPFLSRKRSEAHARRLAALVESSPDAILATTPGGIITDWNRGAQEIFGYTAEEAVGRSARMLVPPEEWDEARQSLARIRDTGQPSRRESRRCRRDGSDVWLSATMSPVWERDGRLAGISFVMRDVGEQRATRERLLESEAELRALLASLPDVILVLDGDGRYLKIPPTAPELLYADPSRMLGRTMGEVLPAELAERFVAIIRRVLATGRAETVEYSLPVQSGRVEFEGTVSRMSDTQVVWVARDVTARNQARERIHAQEAQLRQAQKMEAVGRLAGGVAHDFNNVLTVIRGTVQLMLLDAEPGGAVREDLLEVERAAERAAALTRQLLAFSRSQAPHEEDVDVNAVVGGVESMLRRLIGEDVELILAPGELPGPVRADPGRLEQVLMNLVVNARDAMPGGGTLHVRTGAGDPAAWAEQAPAGTAVPHAAVVLTVADSGTGMDAETVSRIFEPFFTTKPPGQGTGLGLSTVYGIVGQAGGWIQVESSPGAGTRFHVHLPCCEGNGERSAPPAEAPAAARRQAHVLVVEDEDDVRRIICRALEGQGHRVRPASTAAGALQAMEEEGAVDLVISDFVLPDRRGGSLVDELRRRWPGVPVLLVSGYTASTTGTLPAGTPFLEKPFTPSELVARVAELLAAPPP